MKYLKYYNESDTTKLYRLINDYDLRDIIKNKNLHAEKFTNREMEKLRKIFTFWKYKEHPPLNNTVMYVKADNEKYSSYYLYKFSDEWYGIYNTGNNFLCDDMEGLISCLEYLIKIGSIKESSNTKLYKLVDNKNLNDTIHNKNIYKEDFTKLEISRIEKFYNVRITIFPDMLSIENYDLFVTKYSDEWYIISTLRSIDEKYLCDGMEGLLNCLRDVRLIKESKSNSSYEKIPYIVYCDKSKNLEIDSFTKNEIDNIRKIIPIEFKFVFPSSERNYMFSVVDNVGCRILLIEKYTDEWYFIINRIDGSIVMCDQFRGVTEYIFSISFHYNHSKLWNFHISE